MESDRHKDLAEQIEQDRKAIAQLQKKVNNLVARRKANVEELRLAVIETNADEFRKKVRAKIKSVLKG